MTESNTSEIETKIESLLERLESERAHAAEIAAALEADRTALASAQTDLQRSREAFLEQSKAFARGRAPRPAPVDESACAALDWDVFTRTAALRDQQAEITRLESELSQLRSQRVHEEVRTAAARLRKAFDDLGSELHNAWALAATSPDAEQVLAAVGFARGPRSVSIKLPIIPAMLPHVDQLVAASVHAKHTPRFAALLESERQARDAAHDAMIAAESADHEIQIQHRIASVMRPVHEIRASVERSPDVGEVYRRQAEIEREATLRLGELHNTDTSKRDAHGWPAPAWKPEDVLVPTPRKHAAPQYEGATL